MNLALSSYSLRDHINRDIPIDAFPAYAKQIFGLDAVEICQFHILRNDSIGLQGLKDGLTSAGVSVASIPIDRGHISQADPAKRDYDLRLIELWLDAAAFLGAPVARVNSGDGDLQTAIAAYTRLTEYGQKIGVQVVMENHGGLSADPETAAALLAAVPALGTAPDWGNFSEPERYDFLAKMAPRAAIVHAKTVDFDSDGAMPAFDVARCARIVQDSGFTGPYSVEFEGNGDQIDGVHRSIALLRGLLASDVPAASKRDM